MRAPPSTCVAAQSRLRTIDLFNSTAIRSEGTSSQPSSASTDCPRGTLRASPFTSTSILSASINFPVATLILTPLFITDMPGTYPQTWFPVLIQILIAIAVAGAMIGLSAVLGRRLRDPVKSSPYESGMLPVGTARERFSVKFYLVAMVFILFDIEAIFLYPWAVVFRDKELTQQFRFFPFIEMLLFIVLVLAGFFYIYKKGVLDWTAEETASERQKQ